MTRNQISVTQLRAFTAVFESGKLTIAGKQLGTSHSAISQALSSLEDKVGEKLYTLNKQKVQFTPAGKEFYIEAKKFIKNNDRLLNFSKRNRKEPKVSLTIVCSNLLTYNTTLKPFIPAFKKKHPNIHLTINVYEQLVDINEYKADVFWGLGEYLGYDFPHLVRKRLFSTDLGIYAAPSYLSNKGTPNNIEDLDSHLIVGKADNDPPNGLFLKEPNLKTNELHSTRMESSIIVTSGQIELAIAGMGIINAPTILSSVTDAVKSRELIPILEEYWYENMNIYAYYHFTEFAITGVDQFIQFFSDQSENWET